MTNNTFATAIMLLDNMGCIRVTGPDSIKFLQGQLTINLETLQEKKLQLGAVCNPQGRCVSVFWAAKQAEDVLLFQLKETIHDTISHLSKYAVFFKTEIRDDSQNMNIYAAGSKNSNLLKELPESATVFDDNHLDLVFISVASQQDLPTSLSEIVNKNSADFYLHLVENKTPWLSSQSLNEFLPHNIGLPELSAVDFKKGCFTGQEVIARMHYKGKLKTHMQYFKAETDSSLPAPLTKVIADERSVGEVVCSIQTENKETHILALVKDKALESKNFRLSDENGPILELINDSKEKN